MLACSTQNVLHKALRHLPVPLEVSHVQDGLTACAGHAAAANGLSVGLGLVSLQHELSRCADVIAHGQQRTAQHRSI